MFPIQAVLPRARKLFGERNAVADADGWTTYDMLGRRVEALAAALLARGLRQGDRVAILDVNSRQYLEAYYAAVQSGIILVPLNSRLSGPEIEYILRDSGAKGLIFSHGFSELVASIRDRLPELETLFGYGATALPSGAVDYEKALADAVVSGEIATTDPSDIAQIYYTSGTTGQPKGVCLTYGNMSTSMVGTIIAIGLTYRDVWLHTAPLFHLVDAWSVWSVPFMGAAQAVVHFEPERFFRTVEQTRTTASALPPTLISLIAGHPRIGDYDLSSMRTMIFGGSPMPMPNLEFAGAKLSFSLVHGYGITETSGVTTLLRGDTPQEFIARGASAGQPVPGVSIEIRDDDGRRLGVGEVGEVAVRGPRVMKGYWRKDAETRKVLVDGAYLSGDLGFIDEHENLTIVDRKKDMIISGGENVYSAEVENMLSSHPQVAEVAVIGIPSEKWGEEVHAVIYSRDGAALNAQDVIGWCRGKLAGYKIPKSLSFSTEPLPKTGPGKVAKRQLREKFWQGRDSRI